MDYNRFQEILLEEADLIPEKFYEGLNGGVIISPEVKISPYARADDLVIAGEYQVNHQTGCQIVIYYGSMMRLYRFLDEAAMREKIRGVLRHELKHHIERLAGEHSLTDWDKKELRKYLGGQENVDRVSKNEMNRAKRLEKGPDE